jgi:hypothetical protein
MRKWIVLAGILFLAGGLLMAADAPKTGILKIATPGLVIRVAAPVTVKGAKPKEAAFSAGGDFNLPANSYTVSSFAFSAQDDKKRVFTLVSEGANYGLKLNLGKLKSFEIRPGETTTLEGGPPLKIHCVIGGGRFGKNPNLGVKLSIFINYVGKMGEEYSPIMMIGVSRAPPPIIRILDESGKVLLQSECAFAWHFGYEWEVPRGFNGKFKVEFIPPTKAFGEVEQEGVLHQVP